jgi:homocysteine S-methyltransferase
MDFPQALKRCPAILAEGSVIERLRRDPTIELDPHVLHSGFLYRAPADAALGRIYREYLDIGKEAGLPMVLLTPTWRANSERLALAGLAGRDVNGDAVRFLDRIRIEYGDYAERVFIGGLIGTRGDAYLPAEALPEEEAARFHRRQLEALARGGAEFLIAETVPAACEARGMARAMAEIGSPYAISFLIDRTARLLDGTPLDSIIRHLDETGNPPPAGYMVNCVHHSVLRAALDHIAPDAVPRLIGLQANTSAKAPEELEGLDQLETEAPEIFAEALASLHRNFGLRILGGCCGTDDRHIRALARRLGTGATV